MIRRALLLSGILTLGGCAHVGLMPTSEHRHFASAAFEYALLANNAYGEDGSWIQLPRDVSLEVECGNDELGLAYSIFRKEQGARDEYIFAFRGTEDGAEGDKDWKHGNIGRQQQRKSEAIVDAFATAHKDHNIVLIGHSLGGALAVHNSMRVNDQQSSSSIARLGFTPLPITIPSWIPRTGCRSWSAEKSSRPRAFSSRKPCKPTCRSIALAKAVPAISTRS